MLKKHFPKTLYHYCSLSAFQKIIEGHSIWLSDINKSNDMQELRWIKGQCNYYVMKAWVDYVKAKDSQNELHSVDFNKFDEVKKFGELALAYDGKICWVFCLSEIKDDLGQWRGYAEDGTGVAIGFSSFFFELINSVSKIVDLENNLYCKQVRYSEKDIEKFFLEHVGLSKIHVDNATDEVVNILEDAIVYSMSNAALFKQGSFSAEKEWRIIYTCGRDKVKPGFLPQLPDGFDKCFSIQEFGYTVNNHNLVSHIELRLTNLGMKQAVNEITIGPKSKLTHEDIKLFLIANGLLDDLSDKSIKVNRSQSSYR